MKVFKTAAEGEKRRSDVNKLLDNGELDKARLICGSKGGILMICQN